MFSIQSEVQLSTTKNTTNKITKFKMQTTSDNSIPNQTLPAIGAHILKPESDTLSRTTYEIKLRLSDQAVAPIINSQLKDLINDKIKNKKFFYGIEISAKNYYPNTILDYRDFGPILPLFTSIVWLSSEYWNIANIEEVESIKFAQKLYPYTIVLPHISCYHLKQQRLQDFLNLNFSNILTIRGDNYEMNQEYIHSSKLVENIRRIRGDSITIGVAAYPEGHPECSSIEEDLDNLTKKVVAGADFIITQICFSSQAIIDFVKHCHEKGIKIPILVGVFVPDNLRMLESVIRITKVKIPEKDLQEYRDHNAIDHSNFNEYAVHKATRMIEDIFASDVDVYGLQFYTMNKFKNVPKVLKEIMKFNLIKQ